MIFLGENLSRVIGTKAFPKDPVPPVIKMVELFSMNFITFLHLLIKVNFRGYLKTIDMIYLVRILNQPSESSPRHLIVKNPSIF